MEPAFLKLIWKFYFRLGTAKRNILTSRKKNLLFEPSFLIFMRVWNVLLLHLNGMFCNMYYRMPLLKIGFSFFWPQDVILKKHARKKNFYGISGCEERKIKHNSVLTLPFVKSPRNVSDFIEVWYCARLSFVAFLGRSFRAHQIFPKFFQGPFASFLQNHSRSSSRAIFPKMYPK